MNQKEIPTGVFVGAIVVLVLIVAVIGYKVFASGREGGVTDFQKKQMMQHSGYSPQGGPPSGAGGPGQPGGSYGGGGGGSYGGQRPPGSGGQ